MSLCLALITSNMLIMSGDSRESINVNGERYATGRHISKIQRIGNKIIFMGGSADVASRIINDFSKSDNQSIENLQTITKYHKEGFINKYGSEYLGSTAHAIFLVGTMENNKAVVYGINSNDNCRIVRKEGTDQLEVAIIGPSGMNNKAYSLYEEYKQTGGNDVLEMYQYVYDSVSNEEIGGEIRVFSLTTAGVGECTLPIKDQKEIRTVDIYSRSYNSDELTFYANGEKALWFDIPKRKYIFGGDLEAAGGTFSGTLQGVDGVFSGTLQAANGTFTGTLQGANGTFSGTITASTISGGQINGTTMTGSTIRTAISGERIVLDPYGFVYYDNWNTRRVTLGTNYGAGIAGHTYFNDSGQSMGLIYATPTEMHLIGNQDLRLGTNQGGVTYMQGIIDFSRATVIGLR